MKRQLAVIALLVALAAPLAAAPAPRNGSSGLRDRDRGQPRTPKIVQIVKYAVQSLSDALLPPRP